MGDLSDSLRDMGFMPTGEESPVSDDGMLWSKGAEVVCDETGITLESASQCRNDTSDHRVERHRYKYSGKVKMIGGYTSSYDWGYNDERFKY